MKTSMRSADPRSLNNQTEGKSNAPETSLADLKFTHPVDISGQWKQMKCSDCHAGSLAE